MSANNFENNVQQKLDELRLRPTEQVWLEVERRIREKKRRRVIFWFLLPGLVLVGGAAWWKLNQPVAKNDIAVIETIEKNKIEPENNPVNTDLEKPKNIRIENKNETKKTIDPKPEIVLISKEKNKDVNVRKPVIRPVYLHKEPAGLNSKSSVTEKQKENADKQLSNEVIAANSDLENSQMPEDIAKANDKITKEKIPGQLTSDVQNKKTAETKEANSDSISITKVSDTKTDETKKTEPVISVNNSLIQPANTKTANKKDKKKKSKWEIGVTGNIGTTRLYNKGLVNFGMKSADQLFSSPQTSSGTGSGRFNNSAYTDSIPLKGFIWQAGVFAKRKTGKKISYSVGLNLSYYSTNQVVGSYVDSVRSINNDLSSRTSGGFYRYGGVNSYRNKYYYIQLPLLLQWQINKGNKLPPLIWENGFSPSFMFASKALVYDKQANLFFTDRRLYNKFSLLYHTAFDIKLFSRKNHPLTAGFFYDFHISRLQKVSAPDYNYLQSFGLKITYTITPALKLRSTGKK